MIGDSTEAHYLRPYLDGWSTEVLREWEKESPFGGDVSPLRNGLGLSR